MKIYTICYKCKNDVSLWTWEEERFGLRKKYKDKITLTCRKCNHTNNYSINSFKAKESKIAQLVSLIIFVLGTPVLLLFINDYILNKGFLFSFGAIVFPLLIPIMIFVIIRKNEEQRVRIFNNS